MIARFILVLSFPDPKNVIWVRTARGEEQRCIGDWNDLDEHKGEQEGDEPRPPTLDALLIPCASEDHIVEQKAEENEENDQYCYQFDSSLVISFHVEDVEPGIDDGENFFGCLDELLVSEQHFKLKKLDDEIIFLGRKTL